MLMCQRSPHSPLFPYTTLFRSSGTYVTSVDASDIVHIAEVRAELEAQAAELAARRMDGAVRERAEALLDRKSTRLNSSHSQISYAVFCLKKKKIISHIYYLAIL